MQNQLAINGGPKSVNATPARFHFGEEEKAAVAALFDKAIESGSPPGYSGPEETAFCEAFAAFVGTAYADGVNGGTNAVYVALRALDLPPFSEVIVSCVTDPGGMMPIAVNNCIPIPADTKPGSFNVGAEQIEARLTERTSAIVIAHIGGEPADMPAIMDLADRHGLPVVEDCAQAHMARIDGRNVGSFGRYGAFSLMFGKHMCTGGQGGMVTCNTEDDYWRLRRASDRGKPFGLPEGSSNCMATLSCNMDEIHAAIGRVQLAKLPEIIKRRRQVVGSLTSEGMGQLQAITIPPLRPDVFHCYWWWRLKFNADAMRCTKEAYCEALQAEGVNINPNYTAALPTRQDWFRNRAATHPWNNPLYRGNPAGHYPIPNADKSIVDHFVLSLHENVGETAIRQIIEAFQKVDASFAK